MVPLLNFTNCEDVDECFSHFTAAMFEILSKAKFTSLRRACLENSNRLGGVALSKDLKSRIETAQNLDHLFDVLCDSPYWNWMNIKMLTKMAQASLLDAATKLIQQYKDEVYSRKLIDVLSQLPNLNISDTDYTKVKERWNKDLNDITVNDLVNHWSEVEKIFNVEEPTVLLDKVINGSIEIHWLIPKELVEHICQSISNQIPIILRYDILCFDIGGHVIKCSPISQPDASITASGMYISYSPGCVHIYMLCIFITELSLATPSDTPIVDLSSELTYSITKLSVGKSSHTGHGSISGTITEVS